MRTIDESNSCMMHAKRNTPLVEPSCPPVLLQYAGYPPALTQNASDVQRGRIGEPAVHHMTYTCKQTGMRSTLTCASIVQQSKTPVDQTLEWCLATY